MLYLIPSWYHKTVHFIFISSQPETISVSACESRARENITLVAELVLFKSYHLKTMNNVMK